MESSILLEQSAQSTFKFGTKAETLLRIAPYLECGQVLNVFYFDIQDWQSQQAQVLSQIQSIFSSQRLVVRSSALMEDSTERSCAGMFESVLNVDGTSREALSRAVEKVIDSYSGNSCDQILIQPMLMNIAVSGVITTHVIDDGAPYYVVNYDDESGKTDTITGGTGVNKMVLIHRSAIPSMIKSDRLLNWLQFTKEVESVCGNIPVDIEFAQTHDNKLYLLQVRPLTVNRNWNEDVGLAIKGAQFYIETFIEECSKSKTGLFGARTILGEMPDWNPAEIIGTSPRPLAMSLYRHLITDKVWSQARGLMGYRHPRNEVLMLNIAGRPYIDVRNSFNSFIPKDVEDELGHALVDAWLKRLDAHPELHDKVEFEVAQTIMDFTFQQNMVERYGTTLTAKQMDVFKRHLQKLTLGCIEVSETGTLYQALNQIQLLQLRQEQRCLNDLKQLSGADLLKCVEHLLEECQQYGTLAFSVIARHAFIAESMLRSAVERNALSKERFSALKRSITTITSRISQEFEAVFRGQMEKQEFLSLYGHLRPGTYDILSLRYDQRDDLFSECQLPQSEIAQAMFTLTDIERDALMVLLKEAGLDTIQPESLIAYAQDAIAGREFAKFIFTRNLSDSLELLAHWGDALNLTRDELSYMDIGTLLDYRNTLILREQSPYFKDKAKQGREALEITRSLRLGYLIRDISDIYVIPLHRSRPNFVTTHHLEGQTLFLDSQGSGYLNLQNKIICIENADPGFDWIFARGILGLITKFGGSNSHMAIRCAEFGLPAAIGCGEQTFERLVQCGKVELNCADNIVRPIYG